MQVLVELARRRGRVVSRQDLIDTCWGGRIVGDEAVNRCIAAIRRLAETFGGFSVTTIARVGYRLDEGPAAVVVDEPQPSAPEGKPPPAVSGGADAPPGKVAHRLTPAMMAAIGAGAVALGLLALGAVWPRPALPAPETTHRTAFFGFAEDGDDPVLAMLAKSATDQTFQTLGALRLDSAARAETVGAAANRRLASAKELGALYALSGEVRREDVAIKLSMRIEDVSSRTTLWEYGLEGAADESALLPARAAHAIGSTLRCIGRGRSHLTQATGPLVKQVADLCRIGGYSDLSDRYVTGSRALAQAQPNSAHFQAMLAVALLTSVEAAPEPVRRARIAEAKALMQRAAELDPAGTSAILPRIFLAFVERDTLPELEPMLLGALAATEGKDAFLYSQVNLFYGAVLATAGRMRDSEAHLKLALNNDPLQSPARLAYAQAVQGTIAPAQAGLAEEFARFPSVWAWGERMKAAVFLGIGDAETLLGASPPMISAAAVQCWRSIRRAQAARTAEARRAGARSARACAAHGDLDQIAALAAEASLGDLDAAFDDARRQTLVVTLAERNPLEALYWPSSRAMRADPRFLKLMRDVGLLDHWMLPGRAPDFCLTETTPVCALLSTQPPRP